MFQFQLPTLPSLTDLFTRAPRISVSKAPAHNLDDAKDPPKRTRTLRALLKANHGAHSVIYNDLQFHNHLPHLLSSAYIFGAETEELNLLYESESKHLEPWKESPGEIALHDWRDFLGKREYQRAFVDFFEDQLIKHGYDWGALLETFMFSGEEPLVNNLIAGLGHPLIHLGYAREMQSRDVAMEALALAACFRNDWHKYLDDPSYTKPSKHPSTSVFALLERVRHDKRFDALGKERGSDNIERILADEAMATAVLDYWNAWDLKNPTQQFAEAQKLATTLVVGIEPPSSSATSPTKPTHDFFLVHLLTTSHAIRILLPTLQAKHHLPLVRQWWLFVLLVYIAQQRPSVNIDAIKLVDLDFDPAFSPPASSSKPDPQTASKTEPAHDDPLTSSTAHLSPRTWKYVTYAALQGPWKTDAHFVKAARAMMDAAQTWGDGQQFYLKAAVKLVEEFEGWSGFGQRDLEMMGKGEGGKAKGESVA